MADPGDEFAALRGLRIALFTGNYNYLKEGANQALNKLAGHLEDRFGAVVRAYSPVTDTPAFEPRGTIFPVPSIALPGRPEFRLALGLPRSVRADLARFDPQVVHVATPDILDTRAQTYAIRRRIPLVASLHTHFETYLGHYGLDWLRPAVEWHLDRFYRRAGMVLVPAQATLDLFAARYGADHVRLWGRGVDTAQFDPANRSEAWRYAHGIAPDDVAVTFFGRLVREKGLDRFVESIRILWARALPIKPVIVGDGPERAWLQEQVPDAIFTGHVTGGELGQALASCDIFINPSLTEAFGNVSLEAMAAGLAVILADCPVARGIIRSGRDGFIAQPDGPALAEAAAAIMGTAGMRQALGQQARDTASARTWDHVLDDAARTYVTLLARSGSANARPLKE